ncbi:helix-turn-helix domain-containing protein [Clostridium manihotivorum]|uniref:DNA-binding protein n=1 Tax=Clostridium manihotivorum TaxID=2320868 RepID=A0A3R5QYS3_9CLOT|nr:helix-turn-helix domain-containing protein [Clostridium manihotivorum]QAA32757.1 DNA-binding protein [Clostridium manihotivorum]
MDFVSVKEIAEKWSISERRVQALCEKGRIEGVLRFGRSWAIPKDAEKPKDARIKSNKCNEIEYNGGSND